MMQARDIVTQLKDNGEDFEWYPTTKEIIDTVRADINERTGYYEAPSVLDCGAGDGRVLQALTDGSRYAIEKSATLVGLMPRDIFVVGTEFEQQTMIDKEVDVVFCNPPYSQFVTWATKIIREANAEDVYLVIPSRWAESQEIAEAVQGREAEAKVLGSFDFLSSDRSARAKVDIVRVALGYRGHYCSGARVDPFDLWFKENFKLDIATEKSSEYSKKAGLKERVHAGVSQALVPGLGLIETLDELYRNDLQQLLGMYQSLSQVAPRLLMEMEVTLKGVKEALKLKIGGLKHAYWRELADNLGEVTDRLATSSRQRVLDTLMKHTHVDFTVDNAYAIVGWILKNANQYYDSQLIELVERMTAKASIHLYKSNQKTYGDNEWRYCRYPDDLERYALDYRIVLDRVGGLSTSSFSYDAVNGLSKSAAEFLDDICTVASNLGYNTIDMDRAKDFSWESNKKCVFGFRDSQGCEHALFEAKAFLNGNLHIKFNPRFISRLNTEFGRLKGWLQSAQEAVQELDIPSEEALNAFQCNKQFAPNARLLLDVDRKAA